MLPSQIMPALEGGYPSSIITATEDAVPNIANLSRVWFVDHEHVAIANQLLNKTEHNIADYPLAMIRIVNTSDLLHWELTVRFVRAEREGELFERMCRDLLAVSWMAGASNEVSLRSAIVFQVLSVRKCMEEAHHLTPAPETYGELLKVLEQTLELRRSSYWAPKDGMPSMQLLASRGVPGAGTDKAAFASMERLAALAAADNQVIRLRNFRSQMRYVHTIREEADNSPQSVDPGAIDRAPGHFLAFPITAYDSLIGIVACEETGKAADVFDRLEDGFLDALSRRLGETLLSMTSVSDEERAPLFSQVMERAKMQWSKAADPFHTVLSARERQVAVHVAGGSSNAEIAKALFISTRTVTTHLERIYLKLEVSSRAALTRYIVEKGLLADDSDHARS